MKENNYFKCEDIINNYPYQMPIDTKPIKILLRDINGNRSEIIFDGIDIFNNFNLVDAGYNDENYEILIVILGDICIYSQLQSNKIYFEDLIGFFA